MKVLKTLFLSFFFFISSSFAQDTPTLNCDLIAYCFDTLPKIHISLTDDQMKTYVQEGALATLETFLSAENEIEKNPALLRIQAATTYKDVCESLTQTYQMASNPQKDTQKLYETFLSKTIDRIDPHTRFHTPENRQEIFNAMNGDFKGLGIEFDALGENDKGPFKVMGIMPESSTLPQGLQVDDVIIKIDATSASEFTTLQFQEFIKKNTVVSLMIQRGDQEIELKGLIKKDLFYPRVESQFITQDGLVYIQIHSFSESLSFELADEIYNLGIYLAPFNIRGIILDLRNNGGGSLDATIKTADLLLDQGLIAFTKDRQGTLEEFSVDTPGEATSAPLLILIDHTSASASELLAGALQDHGRALVVGSPSYGKGTVQTLWSLMQGFNPQDPISFLLSLMQMQPTIRYTANFYYRPTGQSVQAQGVLPDIEIENPKFKEAYEKALKENPQILVYEKDYKNALKVDPVPRSFRPTYQFRDIAKQKLVSLQMREEFTELEQKDTQLTKAIDMLKIITNRPIEPNHFGKAYYYSAPTHRLHINCDLWSEASSK